MLKEFREFLEKFNVIPIAVGLVLALAFAPMVTAVVNLVLSIVARIFGMEPNEDGVYQFASWDPGGLPVGDVINALITFVLIAWVVFLIIKSLARAGAETESGPSAEAKLLEEIRDSLQSR